jgi:hypothetical protein
MIEQKTPTTRVLAPLILATALAVGGIAGMTVTTPVRATAAPCSSWHSNSDLPVLNLSNGHTVTLNLNIEGTQFSNANPDAILQAPNGKRYDGNAQGLVAGGNGRIDFTVIWKPQVVGFDDPSPAEQTITSRFTGEIAGDGTARGTADDNKNGHVDWATAPGAYSCADAAPKPADPKPADPPAANPPAGEANPPLNCDDPAVFDANEFFCGMAKNLVEGPTDAVTMNINVGVGTADVDIASTASIPGTCKYDATAPLLPAVHKTIDLAANGSTSFSTLSPPPFSTYHVVLSCKGQFNGKTVEFGHVEQDVTAAG